MPGDFGQVLTKMRWAEHQLAILKVAIADYMDLEPYVAVVEDYPEAEEWRIFARLRYPPPATIAHVVGDVLNNLHGVLDHLAWQLVRREGGLPNAGTSFPVKMLNKDASEPRVNIVRRKDSGRGEEPAISDPVVLDLLSNVQPYKNREDADSHPLQVLRLLNGESKHRQLTLISSVALPPGFPGGGVVINPVGDQTFQLGSPQRRLKDGDEIAAVLYAWLTDGGPPEKPKLTTEIALEEWSRHPRTGEPLPLMQAMLSLYSFVQGEILAPFGELPWPSASGAHPEPPS